MARKRLSRGLYGIAETIEIARAFLAGGAPIVQLRAKRLTGRELLDVAIAMRKLSYEAGALFIVNDRLDIALCAEADGVHVGQDDLPVDEVRRVATTCGRDDLIVGLSTHDLAQVRSASALDVDYLGFGPVFTTASKENALPARGTDLLADAVRAAGRIPVVAIGGISLPQADQVRATGVTMAAVIGDVANASDPAQRARDLHAALSRQ